MENVELLKDVLTPETYATVESETKDSKIKLADLSSGGYVSVDKYNALDTQLKSTQKLLDEQGKEVAKLSKAADENSDLKTQLEALGEKHKTELKDIQSKADAAVKEAKIKAHLSGWNVFDVNDVYSHLDTDKITVGEDGTLTGVDEQKEGIKGKHAHYFKAEENGGATGLNHDYGNGGNDDPFLAGLDD